jgi:hypothetical protein
MFSFSAGRRKTNDTELSISQHVENEELTKTCVCGAPIAILIEDIPLGFTQIKCFFPPVKTQPQHTIVSTLIWLNVSVFSRPSGGQYFPVEGTIGAHYTLWDPIPFTGVRKTYIML